LIVSKGDWGLELDEAVFPKLMYQSSEHVDSDDPNDLEVVRSAKAVGYEPAPEAPLYCFLPALWPNHDRAWVRDTRIRHALVSCNGQPSRRVPWSTWDYVEMEADANALLADCGFDPRPAGRLWLLRPPGQFANLEAVLKHLADAANQAGLPVYANDSFADFIAEKVHALFDRD